MSDDLRVGVDVGGTFTDVVFFTADGRTTAKKVLSSPPRFNEAIRRGLQETFGENGFAPEHVTNYAHGATVATNAIITRTGARTALLTNEGFRDVLEIRRMRVPRLYDMSFTKPKPLVPRRWRYEVPGRMDARGAEIVPLDSEALEEVLERLTSEGIESVAVCYLHTYVNDEHERRTKQRIAELHPGLDVSISSEVLPESKEYERTSTTVINAYVQPLVSRYLDGMATDLTELGIGVPVMVMQSNGGMMRADAAKRFPIHIVESGPAAGVTGVHQLTRLMDIPDAICLDMGGTTAKAAIIEDFEILRSPEYEVGGAFSVGHRLARGSGYLLRVPSIDIAEVGAGGGSVAWIDAGGALRVGPQSAGASPGPVAYNLGGEEPTITDANLVLGFTNPDSLAGGALRVYPELAERAIHERVAKPLGLDTTEAAWGIRTVANSSLIRALRAVSTERGRDPGLFTLFAFGGMGPVHALDLAGELNVTRVVIPPLPGLFSALGLLFADVQYHLIRSFHTELQDLELARFQDVCTELEREGITTLEGEGFAPDRQSVLLSADMRYVGQDDALTVPVGKRTDGRSLAAQLTDEFTRQHEETYGYASQEEELQIIAVRCVAHGLSDRSQPQRRKVVDGVGERPTFAPRRCYFGAEIGWAETEVVDRSSLPEQPVEGPLLVEEDNSLTVVLPSWTARADEWSNIVLEAQ